MKRDTLHGLFWGLKGEKFMSTINISNLTYCYDIDNRILNNDFKHS